MIELTEELWAKIDQYAKGWTAKYSIRDEDCVQHARVKAWLGLQAFDLSKSKGGSLDLFLRMCVKRGVLEWMRMNYYTERQKFAMEMERLDRPIFAHKGRTRMTLGDVAPDRTDPFASIEMADLLQSIRPHFSDQEWQVLLARASGMILRHDQRTIAKRLGVTPKSVDNTLTRIKQKLPQALRAANGL